VTVTLSAGIATAAVATLVSGTVVAAADSHSAAKTPQPSSTVRVLHFYKRGPSALYGSDVGAIGVVDPISFRVPTVKGVGAFTVSLSFTYRTQGMGKFYVSARVMTAEGKQLSTRPQTRLLAASVKRTSTTVLFVGRGLSSGRDYKLFVGANLNRKGASSVALETYKMAVEIQASVH
jgi:hypothetical protein